MSENIHPNLDIIRGYGIDSRRIFSGRRPESPEVLASDEYRDAADTLKNVVETIAFERSLHYKPGTRAYRLDREDGSSLYVGASSVNPFTPHWAEDIHMAQAFVHNVRFQSRRWCKPTGWPLGRYGLRDTVYVDAVGVPQIERHLFGRGLFDNKAGRHTSAVKQATLEEIELATNAVAAAALFHGPTIPTIPELDHA